MMLLQYSKDAITPACAIASLLITLLWALTVSLRHKTVDWTSFRQGYLKLVPFAEPSLYNPHAVAQIYGFESIHHKDNVFMEDVPQFLLQFGVGNFTMLVLSLLPNG